MKQNIIFILLTFLLFSCTKTREEKRILVFSNPSSQNQAAISKDLASIQKITKEQDIRLDTTQKEALFVEDSLKKYSAIVFLHTNADALDFKQRTEVERYIQAGGGLVAVDALLNSRYNWPWYHRLVNAFYPGEKEAEEHTNTAKPVKNTEEGRAEKSNKDKFDGGRVFFTKNASAEELEEGIEFAIGDNKELDYDKAHAEKVPDDKRFVKAVLAGDLDEPMELEVIEDGSVYIIERKGNLKRYDPQTKAIKVIARFNVFSLLEDGLLGMALDPNYEKNHWVYFYYSPAGDVPKQHVSRFELIGDSLVMASEKVILEIPVQRETCCHSGGGLEFGPDGNLFIGTGDNTSSKESSGYTPLDERPGRAPFDSQKSSGNTNDLRGKILRIKPEADGSYSIPAGNLFSKGDKNTRPEIYAMGVRNPFRFSIDSKTGYLYWGDVGPDSGVDSLRGPQSYDEFNQARESGNYGWPYFVGDNKAYPDYDFATNTIIQEYQNPLKPVNQSPNNTGMENLPPVKKPMIWYPYGESKEFPMLGTGSRSAMAGPVYQYEDFSKAKNRFPQYYDDKLFIYEWARSWIKVASFDKDGKLTKIEPFLAEAPLVKPIDMLFGPDGALYMIEYGADYFAKNEDARLVRIEYAEGNRAPIPVIAAEQTVGAAPLKVQFSALQSTDYDAGDSLTYEWRFTDDKQATSSEAKPVYTFTKPGIYQTELKVTDKEGESAVTNIQIKVGNSKPQIALEINGNRTFFWDNTPINYQVTVADKEDGTLENGVDPSKVAVNFDYLAQGRDLALVMSQQYNTGSAKYLAGKQAMESSDCMSCHALNRVSVGPSYIQIAQRYKGDIHALGFLPSKIIKGGNGNWGDRLMSAHPQLSTEAATEMVKYILSLSEQTAQMPLKGTLTPKQHVGTGEEGKYFFNITYTDKGGEPVGPLTAREVIALRNPKIEADEYEASANVGLSRPNAGALAFVNAQPGSHISFKKIDLTNVQGLVYRVAASVGGTIELRLGSPTGELVSEVAVKPTGGNKNWVEVPASVKSTTGVHDLFFVFKNEGVKDKEILHVDWIYFSNGGKRSI